MRDPFPTTLEACEPFWSSGDYVLVTVRFADDAAPFHDVYHRDGTYCTPADPALNDAVVARMLAADVPVMEGDEWVLFQKLRDYEPFWTGDPAHYFISRPPTPLGQTPHFTIFHENGDHRWIYEDEVREAVVARMVAAGVELIEDAGDHHVLDPLKQEGEAWVNQTHDTRDEDAASLLSLLVRPSFEASFSWALVRRWEHPHPTYFARFLTYSINSPLSHRERSRLPPTVRCWQLHRIREEVPLDRVEVEALLQSLANVGVFPYVDEFSGGRDGVRFRLTLGNYPYCSDWTWWCAGPEQWSELTAFIFESCERFEQLRAQRQGGASPRTIRCW